jgi:hypothetical protein
MSKFLIISSFALLSAITCSASGTAQACTPVGGTEPPCSAYWKADAVFLGRIMGISKPTRDPKQLFDKVVLHFSVEQSYRGVEGREVDVTSITGTECDTKFELGERWLVYARRNVAAGQFEVWARTTLLSRADEDMLYIRSLAQSTNESAIFGGVYDYPYTAWAGIKIRVAGYGVTYNTVTDTEGRFRVPSIKSGKYTIRATFPAQTAVTGFAQPSRVREDKNRTVVEFEEEVQAGRCGYVQFLVFKPRGNTQQH